MLFVKFRWCGTDPATSDDRKLNNNYYVDCFSCTSVPRRTDTPRFVYEVTCLIPIQNLVFRAIILILN